MSEERFEAIKHAAAELERFGEGLRPKVLVILGSGLSGVADALDVCAEAPFEELHGFASATVVGHAGKFVFGRAGTTPVMAMVGRLHLYEGHSADRVVLPVRAAALLGCEVLIATNASGSIRQDMLPGQTVMLSDHINLLGTNPLTGPNIERLGPRFPAMADAYSPRLRQLAHEIAAEHKMYLAEGVYAAVPGPSFETQAEIRALRGMGADLVGMSTVPEIIAARHAGLQAAAFSLVANQAGVVGLSHEEVVAAAEAGAKPLAALLTAILARL